MSRFRVAVLVTCGLAAGACSEEQTTGVESGPSLAAAASCFAGCFVSATAGWNHSCVKSIDAGNAILCWGDNAAGQLGTGDKQRRTVPTRLASDPGITSVTAGEAFTCGATTAAVAYCWGDNSQGQLGTGNQVGSTVPRRVNGPANLTRLTAGRNFACGLVADKAYCWGANDQGQLGVGDRTARLVPTAVVPTIHFSALSAGGAHACGTETGTGKIYCWGDNAYGQLGVGNTTDRLFPSGTVSGTLTYTFVSSGFHHTCAVATQLAVCWGSNEFLQLGDYSGSGLQLPPRAFETTPVAVGAPLPSVSRISAGKYHSCAKSGSKAYCWGRGTEGQLGDGQLLDNYRSPRLVGGTYTAPTDVEAGGAHTLMVGATLAKLYAWGSNAQGQLGNGTTQGTVLPIQILP